MTEATQRTDNTDNRVVILDPTPKQVPALVRDVMEQTILATGIHAWKIIEPGIVEAVIDGRLVVLESHGKVYLIAASQGKRWTDKRAPVDPTRRWGLQVDWQHYGLEASEAA